MHETPNREVSGVRVAGGGGGGGAVEIFLRSEGGPLKNFGSLRGGQ